MRRSPLKIIEFCLYLLIIIFAIIYILVTGNKPTPFELSIETAIIQTQAVETTTAPPLFHIPKSEFFPQK